MTKKGSKYIEGYGLSPHARLTWKKNTIFLRFNMEAIRQADLLRGGYVDFFWNPVDFELTIKRPGKMAKLSLWRTGVQVCISSFIKRTQYH